MRAGLRYAFATLLGPWMILPGAALEITALLQRGMPWRGEGMWTVEWFAISLFILGPLCAGAAALDAARLSRPGNIHLVVAVPWPSRAYLRAALWTAGPLAVAHTLIIITGLLVGRVERPSVGWLLMATAALVQCLAIVWFAAFGSFVGRFARPILAGLVGAAGALLLNYMIGDAWSGKSFQLLALGAETVTLIGRSFNTTYLISQLVILAATSGLMLWTPVCTVGRVRVPRPGGVVAGVLTLIIVISATITLPANRKVDDPQAPTYCLGASPKLCMYYEHRRYAGLVYSRVSRLSRAAIDNGYGVFVPAKIIEQSRSYRTSEPGVRSLWLPADVYEQGSFSLEDAAYFLIEPTKCGWLTSADPPPMELYTPLFSLLATWLHLAGEDLEHSPVDFRVLNPDEVRRYLDAFARCDLGGLR